MSRWHGDVALNPVKAITETFELNAIEATLKSDRTTTVVVSGALFGKHSHYVLKRYNARNFWHRISRSVRKTRAERCWHMSYAFAKVGINVAEPIFMYEHRLFGLRRHAFFASELVPGKELLTIFATLEAKEKARVVSAVTCVFKALADHRLSHGDMKASNLIWDGERLTVIDLDAAQQHRCEPSWRKANQKDKQRFLRNWRDQPELAAHFAFLSTPELTDAAAS